MSLYPQSAASHKVCLDSLLFCCFQLILTFESIKKLGNLEVLGQNDVWVVVPWPDTEYMLYQVWAVVSFISLCLPMVSLCTKVLQLRINQLVVWFV